MLNRLVELFQPQPASPPVDPLERVRLATCVVLLETARADEEFAAAERAQIIATLQERFALSAADAEELIAISTDTRKESHDLWQFTHHINEHCSRAEKQAIVEEMWRVIYADGSLDAHEDYLAHKFAKLLNLAHSELIRAKVKVLDERRKPDASG